MQVRIISHGGYWTFGCRAPPHFPLTPVVQHTRLAAHSPSEEHLAPAACFFVAVVAVVALAVTVAVAVAVAVAVIAAVAVAVDVVSTLLEVVGAIVTVAAD